MIGLFFYAETVNNKQHGMSKTTAFPMYKKMPVGFGSQTQLLSQTDAKAPADVLGHDLAEERQA